MDTKINLSEGIFLSSSRHDVRVSVLSHDSDVVFRRSGRVSSARFLATVYDNIDG